MSIINLNEPFNRETYTRFLQDEILPDDFSPIQEEINLLFDPKYIKKVIFLGDSQSLGLKVYQITHDSPNDPRVSLTKETFRLMKEYNDFHILAFFTSPGSKNYRLSYVTIGATLDDRKVAYEYSNPRRYSYFLGPDAKVQTPYRFLIKKGRISDIDDLQERFSVEVVNKEFYRRIATLFTKLVGGRRKDGAKTNEYKAMLKLPSVKDHRKMQEFAVRMIGRIVFCWFLKKKATPNGDTLIPGNVLSLAASKDYKNYYHTILEKLFFQVLNTPEKDRREEFKKGPFAGIPFLNGGLFEPHTYDFYELNELSGTSKSDNFLIVPDAWLEELFTLLEEYNFTIDENTSIDVELSVDPEMLGRIFENLLAEINPETGETARKSTGSYYTPRPIVEYMVDESLKQYLLTKTGIEEEKLADLLSFSQDVEVLTEEERGKIIDALDEVKIVDPACGSGAFPMGILQKMVLILQKADPDSMNWLIKQLDRIPDAYVRGIAEEQMMKEDWNYIRKLGIIRNSIYGVDIQQIAVEISKLRVFLSLVVDSKIDDTADNRGIKPLPNLEFKFVCADTLIGLPKSPGGIFEAHDEIKKLKSLRENYFSSFGYRKHQIEKQFREIQDKMFKHSIEMRSLGEQTKALSGWDPFSNKAADWFDPEWMFGIKDGFNIVIANPPYVNAKHMQMHTPEVRKILKNTYKLLTDKWDLYVAFIEKAMNISGRSSGVTMIIPNAFVKENYSKKMREYLISNKLVKSVVFYEYDIFEAAVNNIVLLIQKPVASEFEQLIYQNPNTYDLKKIDVKNIFNSTNSLLARLLSSEIILGDVCFVSVGMVLNADESVAKGEFVKYDLICDVKDTIHSKRYTEGKWIDKYQIKTVKYLEWGTKRVPYKIRRKTFPELYEKEKILINKIGNIKATYDNSRIYCDQTIRVLIKYADLKGIENKSINNSIKKYSQKERCKLENISKGYLLKFILALLNTPLYNYLLNILRTKESFDLNPLVLRKLPIPYISINEQKPFECLVNKILDAKRINPKADTSILEHAIDRLVYELYNLTPEEIAIVEGEYEK